MSNEYQLYFAVFSVSFNRFLMLVFKDVFTTSRKHGGALTSTHVPCRLRSRPGNAEWDGKETEELGRRSPLYHLLRLVSGKVANLSATQFACP